MRATWSIALLVALVVGCLQGCQQSGSERTQSRAGVAIALEARYTAAQIAFSIADRADAACAHYQAAGPMRIQTDWVLEGKRDELVVLRLEESRTLLLDENGNLILLLNVEFTTEQGRSGTREYEWRVVGDHIYYRNDNLPFERRETNEAERADLRRRGTNVFETFVRATGLMWTQIEQLDNGWRLLAEPNGQIGRRVRCGGEGVSDPWLDDLETDMAVHTGVAEVVQVEGLSYPVRRQGEWTLRPIGSVDPDLIEFETTLDVAVSEVVTPGPLQEAIEVPTEISDLRRDRSHHQLTSFLRELDLLSESRSSQ